MGGGGGGAALDVRDADGRWYWRHKWIEDLRLAILKKPSRSGKISLSPAVPFDCNIR